MAAHQHSRHSSQPDQGRRRQNQHKQGGFQGLKEVNQSRLSVGEGGDKIMPIGRILTVYTPTS